MLEQIRNYQVTWPIAFFWEYDTNDDGSQDQSSRTIACNGEQVTSFIKAFCDKIELAGIYRQLLRRQDHGLRDAAAGPADKLRPGGTRNTAPSRASTTISACGSTPTRARFPAFPARCPSPFPLRTTRPCGKPSGRAGFPEITQGERRLSPFVGALQSSFPCNAPRFLQEDVWLHDTASSNSKR